MEYIEGETLGNVVRGSGVGTGLPPAQAVQLILPIAAALHASHQRGIVHRDIKSPNIMISQSGGVKVLDFGIAKVSGSTLRTEQHVLIGTLDYMSPEQARGSPLTIGPTSGPSACSCKSC